MNNLTRSEAKDILNEAYKLNDGPWYAHSINVAKACSTLAENLNLDPDKAYVYGLLHDIGRRNKDSKVRHILEGYNYMKNLGYEDVARYCLTHSFMVKDIRSILGTWDTTDDEKRFVRDYLNTTEYTLYDKIVQLSDYLALSDGLTLIDRRILDVYLRYEFSSEVAIKNWKAVFKLQEEIEQQLGHSIYKLFPEVKDEISNSLIKDVLDF